MRKPLLSLLATVALLAARPTVAQWTNNPQLNTVVRDQTGISETTSKSVTRADGTTYVCWFESNPTTNFVLRMQRLDANGNKLWAEAGVLVSDKAQGTALYVYDMKLDNEGNALVAFQDTRSADESTQVVIYKVSASGALLWGADGRQLLDATATSGLAPVIGVTAANNVVVAWNAGGTGSWVAFQRISPAGVVQWAEPRRIKGAVTSERYGRPYPVATGPDDVLLHYVRTTGTGLGISTMFAQRYDASGTAVWATPTQVSDKTLPAAYIPEPISDGNGGTYVAFNSGNPANATLGDVWVQRVSSAGVLWSTSGATALSGIATMRYLGALSLAPATNELYVAVNVRNSSQSQSGVTLQKFSAAGAVGLGANGQEVFPVTATYTALQGMQDTGTGLQLIYSENTTAVNRTLKALKVSYAGAAAWSAPTTLSSAASSKSRYSTGRFANNQTVVVWEDARLDTGVYAQNVTTSGQLGIVTSTRRAQLTQPLALYPNPGAAPAVQLTLLRAQPVILRIHDLQGRLLHQQTATLAAGAHTIPLPTLRLSAGTYVVQTEVDGQPLVSRWVKL